MLKKYREWIYGIGVMIIVVTFFVLIGAHESSGPFWVVRQVQQNLQIWAIITSATIILMVMVGYFTRRKK